MKKFNPLTLEGNASFRWIVLMAILFSACADGPKNVHPYPEIALEGKGGRLYGGTLHISEVQSAQTLFPPSITDVGSSHLASQVYEGLVKLNPRDLSIRPGIANNWEIDSSGTVYTFYLKKGIFFHDDACFPNGKGRELVADDVVYSLRLLCTPNPRNLLFNSTVKEHIVGAKGYYNAILAGNDPENERFSGVTVIDPYTLELRLNHPHFSFIYALAHTPMAIIPHEAVSAYGENTYVGTGPFMVGGIPNFGDSKMVLLRNPNYHGVDSIGNKLPFIDSVIIWITDTRNSTLTDVVESDFHIINQLPSESVTRLVEEELQNFQSGSPKFIVSREPEMGTHYYQFNLTSEILKNVKVRQALNYAVDRERLISDILQGDAKGPGHNGITPPVYPDYETVNLFGYHADFEQAKQLLAEAGYPNGEGFPVLKLKINDNGYKNTNIAIEVQNQLREVLGIHIDIEVMPFEQKLDDMRLARGDIFRTTWLADYPSPESFLSLFYGRNVPKSTQEPSFPNSTRYVNPKFDALFEKAMRARTRSENLEYLMQAEQILMDDAPLMVMWYQENYKLIHADVRNFFTNALDVRDYSEVYFRSMKKIEQEG